jgi:hypothetical protein
MGFGTHKEFCEALNAGQTTYFTWRKNIPQSTTAGIWTDLSVNPGNPIPNYYASTPKIAAALDGTKGLPHGGNISPRTKHLKSISVFTQSAAAVPLVFTLCDYLLYYPFIEQGELNAQAFDNTVTLPRFTDGKGVMALPVLVAAQGGGQSFFITYTNQDGVAGRTSQTVVCNSSTSTGAIVQTAPNTAGGNGPFIPLQKGDSGIRSVQSLTMLGADVGLITLVLVKPLTSFIVRELTAPVEVDFLKDRPSLPRIYDGAYLNLLMMPNNNLTGSFLHGEISTVFN